MDQASLNQSGQELFWQMGRIIGDAHTVRDSHQLVATLQLVVLYTIAPAPEASQPASRPAKQASNRLQMLTASMSGLLRLNLMPGRAYAETLAHWAHSGQALQHSTYLGRY